MIGVSQGLRFLLLLLWYPPLIIYMLIEKKHVFFDYIIKRKEK